MTDSCGVDSPDYETTLGMFVLVSSRDNPFILGSLFGLTFFFPFHNFTYQRKRSGWCASCSGVDQPRFRFRFHDMIWWITPAAQPKHFFPKFLVQLHEKYVPPSVHRPREDMPILYQVRLVSPLPPYLIILKCWRSRFSHSPKIQLSVSSRWAP